MGGAQERGGIYIRSCGVTQERQNRMNKRFLPFLRGYHVWTGLTPFLRGIITHTQKSRKEGRITKMDNSKPSLSPEMLMYLETKRHNEVMEALKLVEIMQQNEQLKQITNIDGAIGAIEECIYNMSGNMDELMKRRNEALIEIARQISLINLIN